MRAKSGEAYRKENEKWQKTVDIPPPRRDKQCKFTIDAYCWFFGLILEVMVLRNLLLISTMTLFTFLFSRSAVGQEEFTHYDSWPVPVRINVGGK